FVVLSRYASLCSSSTLSLHDALPIFICAFYGEKHASRLSTRGRMFLFSLTLGVYCSSWTFYGATGAAVREGIIFLPIYLGPLILDRKSTRLNSSHVSISYSVFFLKKT